MHAYIWNNGVLEFGEQLPAGAVPLAEGSTEELSSIFVPHAMFRGDHWVVPRVRDARTDEDRWEALKNWVRSIGAPRRPPLVVQPVAVARSVTQAITMASERAREGDEPWARLSPGTLADKKAHHALLLLGWRGDVDREQGEPWQDAVRRIARRERLLQTAKGE
jgi:hypothetical protein